MEDDDIENVLECWDLAFDILKGRMPKDMIDLLDRFITFHHRLYDEQDD